MLPDYIAKLKQLDYKGNPRTPEEQKRLEREAEKKNQEEEKMGLPKKYKMTWTPDLVEKAENDFWGQSYKDKLLSNSTAGS